MDFHIREVESGRRCDCGRQGNSGSIRDGRGAGNGGGGGQGGGTGGGETCCFGGGESGCGREIHSGLSRRFAGLSHCRSGEEGTGDQRSTERREKDSKCLIMFHDCNAFFGVGFASFRFVSHGSDRRPATS